MKKLFLSILIVSVLSCKKNPEKFVNDDTQNTVEQTVTDPEDAKSALSKEEVLKQMNEEIIQTLKDKNYQKFADYIHPGKGVRFSMYAYVNPKEDKNFSRTDFIKYEPTKTLFTWGTMDGSGEVYKATLNGYLKNWVYSKDFVAGQVSVNDFQGKGNSLNNLKKIYPNSDFTENYFKGSEENAEMDWKSLRLVFEQLQGKYYLVGIVNDQWTI